jgi:leucyl aminopeptidase
MVPELIKTSERDPDLSVIYIADKDADLSVFSFSTTEFEYIRQQMAADKRNIHINSYFKWSYLIIPDAALPEHEKQEDVRIQASRLYGQLKDHEHQELLVVDVSDQPAEVTAFLEGLILSHYQFIKHKAGREKQKHPLEKVCVYSEGIREKALKELEVLMRAVYKARDLVNEPLSGLNAMQLGREFEKMAEEAGFSIEVFNRKKIESLRLFGLLAVNKGSVDPPSFSVMEWKPEKPQNDKPLILVGKGVVYDTGGISLKPTSSMVDMKSDMAGAATVAGIMYAAAMNRLPLHIIGLVPATDNRPGGNAYTPGDVITMHNDKTVEVINTDAEGRLLLADALSFAAQYDPQVVFDFATLTGSASIAIGPQGLVAMGNLPDDAFDHLLESGRKTYERVVRLPLWKEYQEMLKSDVADIKNVGGREAGAITAGKFLEYFTSYPWLHFDIAPMAFLEKADAYRGKGATGVGVRLVYDYLNQYAAK